MSSSVTHKKPLSVGQVAAVCRVSKKTVLNWIYDGALKAFTTYGGHYRIWPVNLKKFLDTAGMDIPFEFVDETSTHVLIIDDERPYSQMLRSVISAELPNVEITTTEDGFEGLLFIGELKPQLVILDFKMPKIDGMEVLELLRKRKIDHDMRILVVSSYLSEAIREQLAKTCADAVLDKLADISLLVKTVAMLVRSDVSVFQEEAVR
jgi:two-component system, OmpR family, response regulator